MKNFIGGLLVVAISSACIFSAHAAVSCSVEQANFNRASRNLTTAQWRLTSLENRAASRFDFYTLRKSNYEAILEQRKGELSAAKKDGFGNGIECALRPRPGCVGSTTRRIIARISRAEALVRTAKGRLDAYNASFKRQRERDLQRIAAQELVVKEREAKLATAETALKACQATL